MPLSRGLRGNRHHGCEVAYWLAFVILFLFSALLLLPFALMDVSVGDDDGVYRLIAREFANGSVLYDDIWDNKPPYLYWMYAGLLAPLDGQTWLLRLFGAGCFALVSTAVFAVFYVTSRKFAFSIVFALIFLCALQPVEVFNATLFETVFLLLASGCFLMATRQSRPAPEVLWVSLGGFLAGLAFGFKPTAVIPTFLLVLGYLVFRHGFSVTSIRLGLASIGGWILALAPVALVGLVTGTAHDMRLLIWDNNVTYVHKRSVLGSFENLAEFAEFLWEQGSTIIPRRFTLALLPLRSRVS